MNKRAGRPVLDFIKASIAWVFILILAGVVIAVLSLPMLTLMGAIVLWAVHFALTGAGL